MVVGVVGCGPTGHRFVPTSCQNTDFPPVVHDWVIKGLIWPIYCLVIYSQTSLIRASLIRMPHNPNTLPGNLFYHFLFTMIQ